MIFINTIFILEEKNEKPNSVCALPAVWAKCSKKSQLYLVGRRGWSVHVYACEMPELRHAIQRQDRPIKSAKYSYLFSGLNGDLFLFMRRAGRAEYYPKQ